MTKRRIAIAMIGCSLILILGSLVYLLISMQNTQKQSTISVVWQASSTLTQQDKQQIESVWQSKLLSPAAGPHTLAGHTLTITEVHQQDNWAYISGIANAKPFPGPVSFIAHYQQGAWKVWIPGEPDFCNQINQVPNSLLDQTDKQYYCQ